MRSAKRMETLKQCSASYVTVLTVRSPSLTMHSSQQALGSEGVTPSSGESAELVAASRLASNKRLVPVAALPRTRRPAGGAPAQAWR
jgi:hypothetical protein